jgi:hypothetical protein
MNRKQIKEHILKQIELGNTQITFDYTYYFSRSMVDNCITVFVEQIGFDRETVYQLAYDDMDSYKHDYDSFTDLCAYDELVRGVYAVYRRFTENELDKLVAFIYYNFRDLKARR